MIPAIRSAAPAIRMVAETDDFLTIEGLGIPFGGPFPGNSDDFGTRATSKTDFHWDLFPDDPAAPQYIRPVTYHHGLDPEMGLVRIGGWVPVRSDKRGQWVRMQLDKHNSWFETVRELLPAAIGGRTAEGALSLSSGSIEHLVRFSKNGDWLDWPAWDMSLTPTPSNPWAEIAARASQTAQQMVRVVSGPPEGGKERKDIPAEDFAGPDKSYPIVTPDSVKAAASLVGKAADVDAVKAKIIAIAKRKGPEFEAQLPKAWLKSAKRNYDVAADHTSQGSNILGQIAYLMGCEVGEDHAAFLKEAFDAMSKFVAAEAEEIGTEVGDEALPQVMAYMSAKRIGKRNNGEDLRDIDAIHTLTMALGTTAHATDNPPNDETHQEPDPARAAAALTRKERANAKAERKALRRARKSGARLGAQTALQEVGRLPVASLSTSDEGVDQ